MPRTASILILCHVILLYHVIVYLMPSFLFYFSKHFPNPLESPTLFPELWKGNWMPGTQDWQYFANCLGAMQSPDLPQKLFITGMWEWETDRNMQTAGPTGNCKRWETLRNLTSNSKRQGDNWHLTDQVKAKLSGRWSLSGRLSEVYWQIFFFCLDSHLKSKTKFSFSATFPWDMVIKEAHQTAR